MAEEELVKFVQGREGRVVAGESARGVFCDLSTRAKTGAVEFIDLDDFVDGGFAEAWLV